MISNLFSMAIFQSKLNHSLNFFLCLKNGEDFMSKKFFAIQIVLIFSFVGCGDKNDYVGELNNELPDGKGIMTYEDGSKYEGEWKEGKRYGEGTLTFEDGAKYEGEWKDGEMDGTGKFIWSNGDKYEGDWKNGKKNGQGTIFYQDGSKLEGEFRDDSPWDTTLYDK